MSFQFKKHDKMWLFLHTPFGIFNHKQKEKLCFSYLI